MESLAAFVETGIMFASCIWIVYEAISRILLHQHLALLPSLWPFAVLLVSIVVDFSRSRTLGRIARLHRSDALAADSLHFATDMWASLAVMFGLGATYAGERLALPWLELADPIAAMVVAGVILRVSWRLAHQTIDTLLDATPTTDPTSHQPQSKNRAPPPIFCMISPPSLACSRWNGCAPVAPAPTTSPMSPSAFPATSPSSVPSNSPWPPR